MLYLDWTYSSVLYKILHVFIRSFELELEVVSGRLLETSDKYMKYPIEIKKILDVKDRAQVVSHVYTYTSTLYELNTREGERENPIENRDRMDSRLLTKS